MKVELDDGYNEVFEDFVCSIAGSIYDPREVGHQAEFDGQIYTLIDSQFVAITNDTSVTLIVRCEDTGKFFRIRHDRPDAYSWYLCPPVEVQPKQVVTTEWIEV